jgi:diaminohydroxyphosphoribosylaminopyrimidine deaminase/5-amino-6-(5-phosphoribosylamino)uracil reductase
MITSNDAHWMALAIKEAQKGLFSTTPNPAVGCVLVDSNNNFISKGFHAKAGENHAEVNALIAAGFTPHQSQPVPPILYNATAYVTLEPCSHTGRTPPCANALIEAKIGRVVIANVDNNPLVNKLGIAKLEAAGIIVESGLMEKQVLGFNRAFSYRMQHQRPYVVVKLASSLDGKTALLNGESKWITGEQARADVQKERALSCAILSGADTIIHDNPRLNVREQTLSEIPRAGFKLREKQPLRVIVDGKNRLNHDYQVFNDGQPTLVVNKEHNSALSALHCEQLQIGTKDGFLDLHQLMQHLSKREINRVWTEAGASLCGALFNQDLVNEFVLYQAPMIMGEKAQPLLNLPELSSLSDAIRGNYDEITQVGNDLKLRMRLKS